MEKGATRQLLTFPSTATPLQQILMGEDYLSLSRLPEPLSLWSADPWHLIGAALPLKVGLDLLGKSGMSTPGSMLTAGCGGKGHPPPCPQLKGNTMTNHSLIP